MKEYWLSLLLSLFILFAGTPKISQGGEYKYDNYYWLSANVNLEETDFIDIVYMEEWDQLVVVTKGNKIYTKTSYERGWAPLVLSGEDLIQSVLLDPKGAIILRTPNHLLVKYDFNTSWNRIDLPSLKLTQAPILICSIKSSHMIFLVNQTNIWFYQGEKWNQLPNPNLLLIQTISFNVIKNQLLLGVVDQGLWAIDLALKKMEKYSLPWDFTVNQIFLPLSEYNAWFVQLESGELYRSLDQGASFQKVSSVGNGNTIFGFCEDETRNGVFFAFSKQGVFVTADQGSEWIPMQHGIENVESRAGCYVPYEQRFYVVTTGKGVCSSFAIPNQPEPIQPKDGEEVFYCKPTLAWNLMGGNNLPGSYQVLVSATEDFSTIVFEKQNIMGDSILVPEHSLKVHTPYFWKVRVETQYWTSEWSSVYQFTKRQRWIFTPNQELYRWNEKKVVFHEEEHTAPFIENGIFYLPLRHFLEFQGAEIIWNPSNSQVDILWNKKTKTISIHADHNMTRIKNNRAYISIRSLAEMFGWSLHWEAETNQAVLSEMKGI